tara:strand:- start:758 stop:1030 length:273 start_codon:yes stop_codon:yes gene_type:complete
MLYALCYKELIMNYTHKQDTEILKFLAQYPFEEIDFGGDIGCTQIIGVNYASQEILLRDFCEYTVAEIIESEGFRDKEIDKTWKEFLNSL